MFAVEAQMLEPVLNWLSRHTSTTKTEFPLPWGICDVVGCQANGEAVRRRTALGQTSQIGDAFRVALWKLIPDESQRAGISVGGLARKFRGTVSQDVIGKELECLERRRFVTRTKSGAYKSRNGWMPLQNKLIAVEMKLSRVSDALLQAELNLAFTPYSYVAFPHDTALGLATGPRRNDLDRLGVGLLAVSSSGCTELLCPSCDVGETDDVLQTYVVERFWPDIRKGKSA